MKKKIIFLIFGVINFICGVLITSNYYRKNPVSSSITKFLNSSGDLAIMVFDENANDYVRQDNVPTGNWMIDTAKTYCEGGGSITGYDANTGKVIYSILGDDKCYVYFVPETPINDKIISLASDEVYVSSQNGTQYQVKYFDVDKAYHYIGESPNNYVKFNNEDWFIFGAVNGSEIGLDANTYYTKIIRAQSIGSLQWNTTWDSYTAWGNSTLKNLLNTDYYNRTGDFSSTGILSEYRDYIINTTTKSAKAYFNSGNYKYSAPSELYTSFDIDSAYTAIKIMNASDYVYSRLGVDPSHDSTKYADYSLSFLDSITGHEWTMSNNTCLKDAIRLEHYYDDEYNPSNFYANCEVSWSSEENYTNSNTVRPVTYLKPNVKIIDGNGSQDNPYILEYIAS